VTSIGNYTFSNCTGLTSLTFPNSVTSIGNYTFSNCTGLTSLTIPNSVTSIGSNTFSNCTGLTSLIIPNSVTSIGFKTFEFCTGLTSLTIPNSVTSFGVASFQNCTGLTSLTFPNSVTSIGDYTFSYCTGLTSLTFPNSVTSIGDSSFRNCTSLTSVICNIINPLSINPSVFDNVNQSACSLTVPSGSLSYYQTADVWKNFNPINGVFLNTYNFTLKNNLQFYPNPTKNELFIDTKDLNNTKLEVLDINGKTLFNRDLNVNNTIDTSILSNGIYLFKITSDEGSLTTKVIKN
jgi:hypothetical protein